MKLFSYDHCPYCIRARMIFGLKKIKFDLVTLLNDDETTPTRMIGKKMVPILAKDDGGYMPESLDIVNFIEKSHGAQILVGQQNPLISKWLEESGQYSNKLTMPRMTELGLEEFSTCGAINYFKQKKQAAIGSFDEHVANSPALIDKANQHLQLLNQIIIKDSAVNGTLSLDDILLFPRLRNLTCIKGIKFPAKVLDYTKRMATLSDIDLYFSAAV